MPFTFSHPAIVLPLALLPRRWFSLTGLVIGSMVPDFEYFIRMRVRSDYSHTIPGIFWFDLPLALLLAFVYHSLVRNSLISNLPIMLQARLAIYKNFDFTDYFKRNWLVVVISVLVGAGSHLFWDSFTHVGTYFTESIPVLSTTVRVVGFQVPVFKLLQHGSTLLGAAVIVLCIWRLPLREGSYSISFRYWSLLVLLTALVVSLRLLSGLDYRLYGHVIVTAIAGLFIAMIITPLLRRLIKN